MKIKYKIISIFLIFLLCTSLIEAAPKSKKDKDNKPSIKPPRPTKKPKPSFKPPRPTKKPKPSLKPPKIKLYQVNILSKKAEQHKKEKLKQPTIKQKEKLKLRSKAKKQIQQTLQKIKNKLFELLKRLRR